MWKGNLKPQILFGNVSSIFVEVPSIFSLKGKLTKNTKDFEGRNGFLNNFLPRE